MSVRHHRLIPSRRRGLAVALVAAAVGSTLVAADPVSAGAPHRAVKVGAGVGQPPLPLGPESRSWELTFHDEFDGATLDKSKWSSGFGWGATAGGSQQYCDPENNFLGNGLLVQKLDDQPRGGRPYRAGCLHTKGKFSQRYGFFEARIRAPKGAGFLSAFWAKPSSGAWPPEIDFEEVLGRDDSRAVHMTNFWKEPGVGKRHSTRIFKGPDFSDGFHVFGTAWTPTEIVWYVDGIERKRTSRGALYMADDGPFYVLVDVYIGTEYGGFPETSDVWPQYQFVDYVRVWADRRLGQ